MTADEYMWTQGANMMLSALPEFIRKWRSTDNKGNPTKTGLSIENPRYDPKRPLDDDNNYYWGCIRGITTDMIIDGVMRLCAATYNCDRFLKGDFPEYCNVHTDKKGKPTSIDFSYHKR